MNELRNLGDHLAILQLELTRVNQAILTAAGKELEMLERWAESVQKKIALLTNGK